ncbi:CotH kinase family protein [Marinagarivorans cellulosilyticus]|uniref:CotH protein n=1 Tax=Marinagarivorans cellulosilyticus TaxID=2721545 RepID=A0AAN1WIG4_9GAMM|nr:CotH kinase family protein [Marinagarivorans cellulosilyticus]BCD98203.1 hypothetical protein MARGE09_P2404 [Marinagarivorans cellulosilyticus]
MNKLTAVIIFSAMGLNLLACGSGTKNNSTSVTSSQASSSVEQFSSAKQSSSGEQSSSASSITLASWIPTGTTTTLPQLIINTTDSLPVVTKDTYLTASYELSDIDELPITGELKIRGRGNSTWDFDKKPYRLRLEKSTSLLGMAANKHWVFLANMADKTLIRNDVAFTFSRALGSEFTVADRHIELILNGHYEGVYQLVEHIRLAKNRINLPELDAEEEDPQRITGSYLLEVDFRMATDLCNFPEASNIFPTCVDGVNTDREETYCFDSLHDMPPICAKDPDELLDEAREPQRSYLQQYLSDTEGALFGPSFTDPGLGYAAYIDVASAVDYYIINEYFKNVDGGVASFFMYKKRDGKLHFGPIWDFDFGMGNVSYSTVHLTAGWHLRNTPWFARLFEDPAFQEKVKTRWGELKTQGTFEQLFYYISARAKWLDIAQADNFDRWATVQDQPIFEWRSWFNATLELPGSYAGEVEKLINWQRSRYLWMDSEFTQ